MIDTEGLDEEIRCTMCTNRMRSDRGCDGNCQYDIHMYERIMSVLEKRIKWLLSAQLCEDAISRRQAIGALQQMQKKISGDFTDLDAMVMAGMAYIGDCIGELQDLPSAQPKIIRCKDCAVPHNRWTGCPKMNGTVMPEDGFCSFAERKSDD